MTQYIGYDKRGSIYINDFQAFHSLVYLLQYDKFGIGKDSCISYIDDDGDYLPIDLECEFQEALKVCVAHLKI